ncbi:MAG TPA: hypothetical protein VJ302_37190, partial [Blastocatellia bacterium]|nr:hypothetical protein [Blastocatellia bacterium]
VCSCRPSLTQIGSQEPTISGLNRLREGQKNLDPSKSPLKSIILHLRISVPRTDLVFWKVKLLEDWIRSREIREIREAG